MGRAHNTKLGRLCSLETLPPKYNIRLVQRPLCHTFCHNKRLFCHTICHTCCYMLPHILPHMLLVKIAFAGQWGLGARSEPTRQEHLGRLSGDGSWGVHALRSGYGRPMGGVRAEGGMVFGLRQWLWFYGWLRSSESSCFLRELRRVRRASIYRHI